VTNKRRSLVLITVDCLRADHCGFHGYSRPTTPFLDSLAAESFVVPAAVIAGGPTYYSFPAILASRMPLALGRDVIGLAPGEDTLATALREGGYATAAFAAANPYISVRFGYDQGFDVFRDFRDFDAEGQAVPSASQSPVSRSAAARGKLNRAAKGMAASLGLSKLYDELYFQYCLRVASPTVRSVEALRRFPGASVLVDHAQSWLASVEQRPFFLWLHLMERHSPYYPPADVFHEFAGRKLSPSRARYLNEFWNRGDLAAAGLDRYRDAMVELYDAGIRAADRQIARLVEHLKNCGRWDDCAFVLTADHGEEFLEHGGRYHAPVRLTEEIARVPLMIRVPGQQKTKVGPAPFSHLHLAPTLLDLLDVEAPAGFRGRSLWPNLRDEIPWDEPATMECSYGCANPFRVEDRMGARLLGIRDRRYKLVFRVEPGETEALYDLQVDPSEQSPLNAGSEIETRRRLLRVAQEELAKTVAERDPVARLRSRLRDFRLENGPNAS
jgi:arylsulfatase A-like enzyme